MLPVSGAEQLKTSGAMATSHDLAQRRVLEIREAGAMLVRQKQVPQTRGPGLFLQILNHLGCLPGIARAAILLHLAGDTAAQPDTRAGP